MAEESDTLESTGETKSDTPKSTGETKPMTGQGEPEKEKSLGSQITPEVSPQVSLSGNGERISQSENFASFSQQQVYLTDERGVPTYRDQFNRKLVPHYDASFASITPVSYSLDTSANTKTEPQADIIIQAPVPPQRMQNSSQQVSFKNNKDDYLNIENSNYAEDIWHTSRGA